MLRRTMLLAAVLAASALPLAGSVARATPTASDDLLYEQFGRVFPDPHGCVRGIPGMSPWAKGRVCAVQFLDWENVLDGVRYLERRFPRYVELVNVTEELARLPGVDADDVRSAGMPREDLSRARLDLYAIKVTDAKSPVPEAKRRHFAYSLSIHGIERAGAEGGVRAAEDLVTWAACEADASASPACAVEGPFPKRILEPANSGPTAGEVLREGVVYFMLSNPDGWNRGDVTDGGVFYQRYNGNGIDLNRDFPTVGYTEEQYTPLSEPETRAWTTYLWHLRDRTAEKRFAGAIDLHGMVTSNAFSFTMLGASQRDYRKNALSVETSLITFRDAEKRLTWSSLVAPAGSCPGPVPEPFFDRKQGPMCTDQWGTVWDTIRYQVSGGFGDWMDSSFGLDAVGVANEMALSHLGNCGIGTCFIPEVEQLHIDGNKGLIYAQIASLLREDPVRFQPKGAVAYVHDPRRIRGGGADAPRASSLPPQAPIEGTLPTGAAEFTFDVKGPADGVRNGGLTVQITFANVGGIQPTNQNNIILEYCGPADHAGDPEGCREVARYYNQSGTYMQAGARIDLNDPRPGPYRIATSVQRLAPARVEVTFSRGPALPIPRQAPYDASRMDFFTELNRYIPDGKKLSPLTVAAIIADPTVLNAYDTIVAAGDALSGAKVSASQRAAYGAALKRFVEAGGNLVLTDGALTLLPALSPKIGASAVTKRYFYAGWMDFTDGQGPTYDRHPLAKGVNLEGAAEGQGTIGSATFVNGHQTYEPGPIGYYISPRGAGNASCNVDRCDSPNWIVEPAAWNAAGGSIAARTIARQTTQANAPLAIGVSLGELRIGKGVVRIAGALLPDPSEANPHPFGLGSYALTYTGYQVFENLVGHTNAARAANVRGTRTARPPLPATGVESAPFAGLTLVLLAAAAAAAARRMAKVTR